MRGRPSPFSTKQALSMFAMVLLLLIGAGPLLAPLGLGGLVLAQLAIIGGLPLLAARLGGVPMAEAFGMSWPGGRVLLGAVLVGASFWALNLLAVVPIVERYLGGTDGLAELERQLLSGTRWLPLLIVALALVPALCEELLLRGVVARSLQSAIGLAGGIAGSALLFGLMHLSVPRFLPTLALGLVLGWAALASGALVPAMVIHFLNNSIALAIATGHLPGLASLLEAQPIPLALVATVATVAGLALLRIAPAEADSEAE